MIYRPQNFYCVHVDNKSNEFVRNGVRDISGCFDNVFVAPVSVNVKWSTFTVIQPELICMEELWKRSKKWKYFINLTGQEFPLRTNEELVRILKAYNGANNMEGTIKRMVWGLNTGIYRVPQKFGKPPCGVQLVKGSTHITASKAFVDYLLHDPVALKFREWVKEIKFVTELLFSSLNHSPHLYVPGSYTGVPETHPTDYPFITRFKNWGSEPFKYPCLGNRWTRHICILSVYDLPLLSVRPELFANKFHSNFHPLALDCLQEMLYNRTKAELEARETGSDHRADYNQDKYFFNDTFYRNLPHVKNRI